MNQIFDKINKLKGFMPIHEGQALTRWSHQFSMVGPILEIGSFCGKSSIYLSLGAILNNENIFTIDHHLGSEEHQINEEYFDKEIYDFNKKRVDTLPLLIKNINNLKIKNIIPIISNSKLASEKIKIKFGLIFIDGSHSYESANSDYESWEPKIRKGGALVIHDIFEDPKKGGQAPYEIYLRAIKDGYQLHERVDTIACLIKV